jgi:hypothetical protein
MHAVNIEAQATAAAMSLPALKRDETAPDGIERSMLMTSEFVSTRA